MDADRIKKLEQKLIEQGRVIECIDPRVRSGHPPDYEIRFANGEVVNTCSYSYEAVLAYAVILKEPEKRNYAHTK